MRKDRVQPPFQWGALIVSAFLLAAWFVLALLVRHIDNQPAAVIIGLKAATLMLLPVVALVIAQMFMRRPLWQALHQLVSEMNWPDFHQLYPFILLVSIISGCAYVMRTQPMSVEKVESKAPLEEQKPKAAKPKKPKQKKTAVVQIINRVPVSKKPQSLRARRAKYESIIVDASRKFGVDYALVMAVAHVESGFNPSIVSPKGAVGIMQLLPSTAKRFGVKDIYNPDQNINGGVQYLRFLLDRYKGSKILAVAAYNAGEGNVDDYNGRIPPFKETRKFVPNVLSQYKYYKHQHELLAYNF